MKLPAGLVLRTTNPKALLILGRDEPASEERDAGDRALDLVVIRRIYTNVIDILIYDDLLRRLDNVIANLIMRIAGEGADGAHDGARPDEGQTVGGYFLRCAAAPCGPSLSSKIGSSPQSTK